MEQKCYLTRIKFKSYWPSGPNTASTSSPSFLRSNPWSTKTQVNWFPIALEPTYKKELFELGIPILGLCYGAQLMQHVLGGKVEKADVREYGKSHLVVSKQESKLMKDVPVESICWMSHFDYISKIAPGFEITSYTTIRTTC